MANPAYDLARAQLSGGGELALEAMDEYSLLEAGRKTYNFVVSVRRNKALWAIIQARAAQIRAQEGTQCL